MPFHIISLGLGDEKDVTVRGLELIKKSKRVFLEAYTAILGIGVERLEEFYGCKITVADRKMVEQRSDELLADAETEDIAFLVVGDAFAATTHHDLFLRAAERKITVKVVHNASIMNAVACCGLQLYSFGQTVSIPYFDGAWRPESFYDKIKANRSIGLHTLALLDIRVKEQTKENLAKSVEVYEPPRFMTVNEAIAQLMEIEEKRAEGVVLPTHWAFGLARVGQDTQLIVSGTVAELAKVDFGAPLHSLVLAGPELHSIEEDMFFNFHWDRENRAALRDAHVQGKEAARMAELDRRREERRAQDAARAAAGAEARAKAKAKLEEEARARLRRSQASMRSSPDSETEDTTSGSEEEEAAAAE
jgi:diphthine synthase